jgi:hypothetical protein
LRIRSKASRSARARRRAKYSSVLRTAIFSATAVTMNWFMLVPSSAAIFSRASFKDTGRRSG